MWFSFIFSLLCSTLLPSLTTGRSTIHVSITPPPLCCGWRAVQPDPQDILSPSISKSTSNAPSSSAFADQEFSFVVALKQRNISGLHAEVQAVSDPLTSRYGDFLTLREIEWITSPLPESFNLVINWAEKWGLSAKIVSSASVEIRGTVAQVEELLWTRVLKYINDETGQITYRVGKFKIIPNIHRHVDAFFGLHGLPLPPQHPVRFSKSGRRSFPVQVTPSVIARTYGIDKSQVKVTGSEDVRQAVAEFQGQYEKDEDLAEFFKRYVPCAKAGDEKVFKFVGDPDKQVGGVEASLDIQYIMGVAPHVKSEFWMYANYDFCDDLRTWTEQLLQTENPPLVHSVSYGWQGDLNMVHCEEAKVAVIDANFAKLAARGITIIFSSGDSGSGYSPTNDCSASTGKHKDQRFVGHVASFAQLFTIGQCCAWGERKGMAWSFHDQYGGNCTVFSSVTGTIADRGTTSGGNPPPLPKLYPSWPASSPYVTSVGATRFVGQRVGNEEMATDQFGSGGGFSAMFQRNPAASWQEEAVKQYLSIPAEERDATFPPKGSFNPAGRATPDVSLLGEGYQVVVNGGIDSIGGTSASAPAFGGMISMINEARHQAGMKPLGFLNPFLYQHPEAFNDIVKGTNAIGRGTGPVPFGFKCTRGWDPATGLGTPKFPKLLQLALEAGRRQVDLPPATQEIPGGLESLLVFYHAIADNFF